MAFFPSALLTCTHTKLPNPPMDQSYIEPWITLRDLNIADAHLFTPIERYSADFVGMVLNEASCKLAGAPVENGAKGILDGTRPDAGCFYLSSLGQNSDRRMI